MNEYEPSREEGILSYVGGLEAKIKQLEAENKRYAESAEMRTQRILEQSIKIKQLEAENEILLTDNYTASLLTRIKQLEAEIAENKNAWKEIMDEKCNTDEVHCTCVPVLREGIKQLEAERDEISRSLYKENQRLREAIESMDLDHWVCEYCESNAKIAQKAKDK